MFEGMPFFMKGLITAGLGLCGTFLVLIMIFFAVKLMQRLGADKAPDDGEPSA